MSGKEPDVLRSTSGIQINEVYDKSSLDGWDGETQIGRPGEYPFTRGPYPSMYRGRPWTMRQYAGFGSAAATNERFKGLLDAGQTGLSVAFDLPTQMGIDSDHALAEGEVGKVGVAIDSIEDMRTLFAGIPLGSVSTSMTINATAPMLVLLYQLVAEEQGVSPESIRGTVQNDILKEYIARGTYIYPVAPSMRLVTDVFAYCNETMPAWNTISISGYHIREAGSTAAQELAFTIANGLAYVESAVQAGLDVDEFASRLSFFWNSHNNLFEEVAKFRAARRMWARLMKERVGAADPASWRMRFHTQTAGSTLTAQQPLVNIVRTTVQALAGVLGGTQSLHTNSFDEALGLPTELSATVALRTQQVLAYESGMTDTVDPLAGSYFIESLTDAIEERALALISQIDERGGAVQAISEGFPQREIEDAAYAIARAQDAGEQIVVGVNEFTVANEEPIDILQIDSQIETGQVERLRSLKSRRDSGAVADSLTRLRQAAESDENVMSPLKAALASSATIGEVSDVFRTVFGVYRPTS